MADGPGILEPLRPLAVSLDRLSELPDNPRRGEVDAVAASYRQFGQRKPVVARVTGRNDRDEIIGLVSDGNHQLKAARKLGWSELAVVFVEEGQTEAEAYALAANHVSDLGGYDPDLLHDMMARVAEANQELFAATAYNADDLSQLGPQDGDAPTDDPPPTLWGVIVECDDEAEQVELLGELAASGRKVRALM